MNDKVFYITTPIYYVNDVPHIGHAYTTIAADVAARYWRSMGYDVLFATGTDEHGQKIQQAAQKRGITPKELADEMVENFKRLWKVLNISNDVFIRTTDPKHEKVVQYIFERLLEKGDIYKGTYEGWYCVPCETYVPESQLTPERVCPDCGRPLQKMSEESYFFRMSKYEKPLLEFYENNPDAILPKSRYNEIVSFIKGGLKDQSISRTTIKWGIPVPGDPKHVIYVWFDALINYLTVCGYPEDKQKYERYWPVVHHLIGKDILRFHCVVWPAMLLALGLRPPKLVFAHGWWTVEGEKMSKSKGNVVDPFKVAEEFGVDPFRYFLLREVPFGLDGDFSEKALIGRINSDLANDLGNLLSRSLKMVEKYFDGYIPEPKLQKDIDKSLKTLVEEVIVNVEKKMKVLAFDDVLKEIWKAINLANKYIDETQPWKLGSKKDTNYLPTVLYNLCEVLRIVGKLLWPFMPESMENLYDQLGLDVLPGDPENILEWGKLKPNTKVNRKGALFPRIDLKKWEKQRASSKEKVQEKEPKTDDNLWSIEDFRKLDLRVAKVISVENVKNADKLYKLTIDLGDETRTIVTGIKDFYKPQELKDRLIVVIANLKPARIRGVESQGMLLAAEHDNVIALLMPDKDVPPGSKIL